MTIPDLSLQDKVALITGAKRGIGKSIALAFAEAGADVVICTRMPEGSKLEAVADDIRKLGRTALAVQADVRNKADVDRLVKEATGKFGRIDILVNNAGISQVIPLLEQSEEDWDKIIDTDLKGPFLCSQAAARVMIEHKGGNIINVTSIRGVRPRMHLGAYCIAKAAQLMLTKALALELAQYNIRVNSLAPSMIETAMTTPLLKRPGFMESFMHEVPLGRIAFESDMIGTALFLASDASQYITGESIFVDGGQLI